jgi:hypothetical protein
MAEVVVIEDENNDSSQTEETAPEPDNETVDDIVEDVVHDLTDVVEDVVEEAAESAAVEAVTEEVQEIVAEAAAVTTEAQFSALHQRLDEMQQQIITLSTPPPMPEEAIVVVDDDAPVELMEDRVTDAIVSDVEEGVPGTDTGEDEAPGKYQDSPDERPNRKLGWKAYVLGGSGGTGGRRR